MLVYRLLFILKLESAADPAHAFSFASSALWRGCLSPNRALGPLVRRHLDQAHDTGHLLEAGLRTLFRAFRDGLTCSELAIAPLGGALFGRKSTPLLDRLSWGERPVALLLDRLLWAAPKGRERERVHYAALDVEDLGSVYEGLLELEPGIATEPMARLRRGKLEVVVPAPQAEPYRTPADATRAAWVEDIPTGRFFLRAGLGRKATGSFYTPHAFVQFLVREALGPSITAASPDHDPDPAALLAIKVLDPAAGSGHFLVEACRFLGDALYTASRLCDELASAAEAAACDATPAEHAGFLARAATLRHRLAALPDPDATLLTYLPSRVREGGDSGLSQQRALAICRRLVAVHCLYGVDRNALAVELAKLSLWLESYSEGLPLTFLDHRLIQGDSITGPFFSQLEMLPVGGQPLDPLLARGVTQRLNAGLAAALAEINALEATVGKDIADLSLKQAANTRLDRGLASLRLLARAWSGAAMLATREADDEWLALARHVAEAGTWPTAITTRQSAMLAAGTEALPWDLTFPDIFHRASGFDVVLGNPPWDVVQYSTRDFVAAADPRILDAATKQERLAIERRVLADDGMRDAFQRYKATFDRKKRIAERLFQHQRTGSGRDATAGNLDDFRLFAERSLQLAAPEGAIGMLLPSAFHANEGTTAIRQLYLDHTRLDHCLSFENRRKLFDIDSRFKFSLLVAHRPGPTGSFRCAFYLDSMAQIADPDRLMTYDRAFLMQAGGRYLTFPELRGPADLAVGRTMLAAGSRVAAWCQANGIRFGRDLHMTDDAAHFIRIDRLLRRGEEIADPAVAARLNEAGYLVLHEGKTFHQYTDTWDTAPRYAVPMDALRQKPTTQESAAHFRLVFRDIARASDERTMIAAIAPPGVVFGHTATVERAPGNRPDSAALVLCALFNACPFDWLIRQKAATHLSLYIVEDLPVPEFQPVAQELLARSALRLSCNHSGYARLSRKSPEPAFTAGGPWPMVPAADMRWQLRAATDAVIAWSYGLDEPGYARILSSFNHKSWPQAPELCLAAFRDLSVRGMAAFCTDAARALPGQKALRPRR